MGGSVGIAILTTLLTYYSKQEYSHLADYVNTGNQMAVDRFHMLQGFMMSKGAPPDKATEQALLMLSGTTMKQALMLAYNKLFLFTTCIFIGSLPLLLFLKPKKAAPADKSADVHMAME